MESAETTLESPTPSVAETVETSPPPQAQTPLPQTVVTRVTKEKRVKDPQKQAAGKLGAAIRTHNLKIRLHYDIEGKKVVQQPTPAEGTDWAMFAVTAGAGAGIIFILLKLIQPQLEPAKQQPLPVQADSRCVLHGLRHCGLEGSMNMGIQ